MRCQPLDEEPGALLHRHLARPASRWSERLSVSSRRGALHVGALDDVRCLAFTTDDGRVHEIAFSSTRRGAQRRVIAALDEATYDLGIGTPHVDLLVRLAPGDAATGAALREALGAGLARPRPSRRRHRPRQSDAHPGVGRGPARGPSADPAARWPLAGRAAHPSAARPSRAGTGAAARPGAAGRAVLRAQPRCGGGRSVDHPGRAAALRRDERLFPSGAFAPVPHATLRLPGRRAVRLDAVAGAKGNG